MLIITLLVLSYVARQRKCPRFKPSTQNVDRGKKNHMQRCSNTLILDFRVN
jgi:hypothetical protein